MLSHSRLQFITEKGYEAKSAKGEVTWGDLWKSVGLATQAPSAWHVPKFQTPRKKPGVLVQTIWFGQTVSAQWVTLRLRKKLYRCHILFISCIPRCRPRASPASRSSLQTADSDLPPYSFLQPPFSPSAKPTGSLLSRSFPDPSRFSSSITTTLVRAAISLSRTVAFALDLSPAYDHCFRTTCSSESGQRCFRTKIPLTVRCPGSCICPIPTCPLSPSAAPIRALTCHTPPPASCCPSDTKVPFSGLCRNALSAWKVIPPQMPEWFLPSPFF